MQNTGQFLKSAIKSIHNMINIFLKLKVLLVFANKNLRVVMTFFSNKQKSRQAYI